MSKKKITLDLNVPYLEVSGKQMVQGDRPTTLGQALGEWLPRSKSSDNSIKYTMWGIELYKGNPIELDEQDQDVLKAAMKELPIVALLHAQVLQQLKLAIEQAEKAEAAEKSDAAA